ncbi:DNA-J related domain-containing protein [Thiohalophilus sp.]|uniref:DNA-J related domain-containing protein n=1 Tax=Thiohalophilus sp. TaxID=3028392 RepID=UPI002ACE388A|nr:DNA-J related domain-containing protein [Thiohalophilus sp.]MDZ7804590.1 DNA-J related domain-containing protein [Thiohalophilus sp.]
MSRQADQSRSLPDSFYQDIEQLLAQHPRGMDEYTLLQALKEQGYFSFSKVRPAPPLELFQMHFLLMHGLYRLQRELLQRQQAIIEISALKIRMWPWQSGEYALTETDPLRDYYLDMGNLQTMTEADVNQLLDAFWREFVRFDGRAEALAELGLSDPVDDEVIKQTYRRLAMQHHPDRGGEAWRLQAINAAYEMLCKSR